MLEPLTVYTLPHCASLQTLDALDAARLPHHIIDTVGAAFWERQRAHQIRAFINARGTTNPYLVPVDPMDDLTCDSCQ